MAALEHTVLYGECERCGEFIGERPACHHTNVENCVCNDCGESVHIGLLVTKEFLAPTCTEAGHIRYLACNDCGTALYYADTFISLKNPDDAILPALGHNYVGGVCNRCKAVESVSLCLHTDAECDICEDCNPLMATLARANGTNQLTKKKETKYDTQKFRFITHGIYASRTDSSDRAFQLRRL